MAEKRELMEQFRRWIEELGKQPETIEAHLEHVKSYLDAELPGEDFHFPIGSDEDDPAHLERFFLEDFPRSAPETTSAYLKKTITSIKKFYTFLDDAGVISRGERNRILRHIKTEKERWLKDT